MNRAAIERWVSGGESAMLGFKESTGQPYRASETVCGFLNGDSGTVILGVTSEGKIVGQEATDETRRWENQSAVGVSIGDLDAEEILLGHAPRLLGSRR